MTIPTIDAKLVSRYHDPILYGCTDLHSTDLSKVSAQWIKEIRSEAEVIRILDNISNLAPLYDSINSVVSAPENDASLKVLIAQDDIRSEIKRYFKEIARNAISMAVILRKEYLLYNDVVASVRHANDIELAEFKKTYDDLKEAVGCINTMLRFIHKNLKFKPTTGLSFERSFLKENNNFILPYISELVGLTTRCRAVINNSEAARHILKTKILTEARNENAVGEVAAACKAMFADSVVCDELACYIKAKLVVRYNRSTHEVDVIHLDSNNKCFDDKKYNFLRFKSLELIN